MDKVNLTSLGTLAPKEDFQIDLKNERLGTSLSFQVHFSIPYENMLTMIQKATNFILEDRPFISGPVKKIITEVLLVAEYTNLDLSEIDNLPFSGEDLYSLYDLLESFNIPEMVINHISPRQYKFYISTLEETLNSLVQYRNSAVGFIDHVSNMASDANSSLTEALSIIGDEQQLIQMRKFMAFMDKVQTPEIPNGAIEKEAEELRRFQEETEIKRSKKMISGGNGGQNFTKNTSIRPIAQQPPNDGGKPVPPSGPLAKPKVVRK